MSSDKYFYYKKSRMSQLRSFCAVVKNNCVAAKAAKEINVEPATITKQIQSLENDLDIVLFDRSEHKKLKLTKEGNLFYKEAVKHLNGINSLFDNFNGKLKEYNDTHLNIALHYTAATHIFPEILGKMLKMDKFKDLNIKIFQIPVEEAEKKLINKEIDLAFYPLFINDNILLEIEKIKSIKHGHVIIFSKNHIFANKTNITRKDIENSNFLIRDTNTPFSIYKYLKLKQSKVEFENAKIETTIELIRHIDAITGVPKIIFDESISKIYNDIIGVDISEMLSESHYYIMKLKNGILKDSAEFVFNELKNLSK